MDILSIFKKKKKEDEWFSANCGHQTKIRDSVSVFGEINIISMIPKSGKIEYCHKCLEKMIIKCAWCQRPIFPDHPITLYDFPSENFVAPEHSIIHSKDPVKLVGCLRPDCADTGMDRAGFWVSPGKVEQIMTAYERIESGEKVVIINDLTKL